jgi:CRP-like cAMP-binding protein
VIRGEGGTAEAEDEDARWLSAHGEQHCVPAGACVATGEAAAERVFIVLDGEFYFQPGNGAAAKLLRPGTFLGELSCGERLSSHARLSAATDGVLLCLARDEVERRLSRDPAFALRLRRALGGSARRLSRPPPAERPPLRDYAAMSVGELINHLLRGEL